MRGMPLTVKAFRGKSTPTYIQMGEGSGDQLSDDDSLQENALHIHQVSDLVLYMVCKYHLKS